MTVWITGATGFLGRYLADELHRQGCQVIGTTRSKANNMAPYQVVSLDLADRAQLERFVQYYKPDYVVHLAAQSFVAHENASDFYASNVVSTDNVLSVLSSCSYHVGQVLLCSSANVYGLNANDHTSEQTPVAPVNHYATSKVAMELMAKNYTNRLPIRIMRPFNFTGVGQAECFLVPKLVRHYVHKAVTVELGNLEVSRDFTDVRDIVTSIVALLGNPVSSSGDVFNIASGRAVSLRGLIERLNRLTGHCPEIISTSQHKRQVEIPFLSGDASKLRHQFGWEPRFSLDDTLSWMVTSLQTC